MENDLKKYETYKNHLLFYMGFAGLWPSYKRHPYALRKFFAAFSFFVSSTISLSVLIFCFKATTIVVFARGVGAFVSYISVVIKVATMTYNQKKLKRLNEGVSALFYEDLKNPANHPYLMKHARSFSKMFYVFDYFIIANLSMFAVMPLFNARHGKFTRMFPLVVPFAYEPGGAVHWGIYVFELIFAYYLWTVTCGVDMSLGLYAFHYVGELKILTEKFKNLKTSDNYRNDIKEIVDRHSKLIETQHVLEEIYGFLVLWLAVTCAIIMCMIVYQTSLITEWSALKVGSLFTWTGLKVVQAFSYAWFGNIISDENKECTDAIWDSYWPGSGDMKFMQDVVIVLSQRSLVFKAKGLMFLDFNMFSKILNTTISYFFLLQTLEEKNLDDAPVKA